MKGDPTYWLLARAAGITAYGLLTASVLAGLVLKSRPLGRALKGATVTEIHRFLTLLALGAVAVHGVALLFDSVVEIRPEALFVPGLSPYRPLWTGVGVVTAELMLVVYLSFPARRWIGAANWRRLHWTTYALYAGATVHGVMSGTDTPRSWVFGVYLGAVGATVMATAWRLLVPPGRPAPRPQPAER